MANGTTIANVTGGVSLVAVIGFALAAGEYKSKVDLLVEEREEQQMILLEQRTLQVEQKALNEDIEDLGRKLDAILLELRSAPPQ